MEIPQTINVTLITNRNRFAVFVIIFLVGGTGLSVYLFFLTKSIFILFSGIFIFFFFPFIFKKTFRKKFSEDILVTFSQKSLSVEFKDPDKNGNLRVDVIKFDEIKLFKTLESSRNDFSALKLVLKDGRRLNYTFAGQNNNDICYTDINFNFKKLVESYNSSKSVDEKIKIMPSFFATKVAHYLGITFTVAMAAVAIYFGIKKPKTLILSIGFLGIYFQMVSLRKKALKEKSMFS